MELEHAQWSHPFVVVVAGADQLPSACSSPISSINLLPAKLSKDMCSRHGSFSSRHLQSPPSLCGKGEREESLVVRRCEASPTISAGRGGGSSDLGEAVPGPRPRKLKVDDMIDQEESAEWRENVCAFKHMPFFVLRPHPTQPHSRPPAGQKLGPPVSACTSYPWILVCRPHFA